MSRSCLGRVSVLSLSFFGRCLGVGVVSVMSRSPTCLGLVSVFFWVMSRCWCCLGDVSVMSHVLVVSRSCLCLFLGHVSVLVSSRSCLGDVSVMSR